jgi:sugar/nucleoside kinase (ribokinase family)
MDVLDQILKEYVDIVFANEDEARAYCGSDDPLVGLNKLAEHCEVAAVKVGAEGAFIKCGDELVKVDSHQVEALDTTGAGDLWASGFLFGHCRGLDLEKCGMIGSLLGSTVVQQVGALIPSEDWSNLEKRISEILS